MLELRLEISKRCSRESVSSALDRLMLRSKDKWQHRNVYFEGYRVAGNIQAVRFCGSTDGTAVFILSSDRSGSTWLGYVLGSAPDAEFVGEFWRAWNEDHRQPCARCFATNAQNCPVLVGVEQYTPQEAYQLVLLRSQKRFLIDSSKRADWARKVITKDFRLGARFIHLIRDPRGWYASESRRRQGSATDMIRGWVGENLKIRNFLADSGIPSTTVFYEELAACPGTALERLCFQIGCAYTDGALRYWEKIHHAFAANGASTPVLRPLPGIKDFSYFVTGDDEYYSTNDRKSFVDERWKGQLAEADEREIREDSQVSAFFALYDRVLTPDTIAHLHGRSVDPAQCGIDGGTHLCSDVSKNLFRRFFRHA